LHLILNNPAPVPKSVQRMAARYVLVKIRCLYAESLSNIDNISEAAAQLWSQVFGNNSKGTGKVHPLTCHEGRYWE